MAVAGRRLEPSAREAAAVTNTGNFEGVSTGTIVGLVIGGVILLASVLTVALCVGMWAHSRAERRRAEAYAVARAAGSTSGSSASSSSLSSTRVLHFFPSQLLHSPLTAARFGRVRDAKPGQPVDWVEDTEAGRLDDCSFECVYGATAAAVVISAAVATATAVATAAVATPAVDSCERRERRARVRSDNAEGDFQASRRSDMCATRPTPSPPLYEPQPTTHVAMSV
ncbi:hypothetical protein T492DRAFT_1078356 [Pavlovales sp. CCMP2436]|nr:hypothetical protein T492DRAFT_1078356 [Pavlovales sp. CCMP2436]